MENKTNRGVFLTAESRKAEFHKFCNMWNCGGIMCCDCKDNNEKRKECIQKWLDSPYENTHAHKCIYCGGDMEMCKTEYGYCLLCMTTQCGATSYRCKTKEEAIELYNKTAKRFEFGDNYYKYSINLSSQAVH